MALRLPSNFAQDIQARDTNLVPLVLIGTNLGRDGNYAFNNNDEHYAISTNSIHMYGYPGSTEFDTMPILLNVPSLNESIDIEKRNYKISNVNIAISNLPYDGKRFSERVTGALTNVECRVYWVSPNTHYIHYQDMPHYQWPELVNDQYYVEPPAALQIYYGIIRRYTHDDEKVHLTIEDRSQATFHKDLPSLDNYLEEDDSVPDKYKNKPIPMVYGHVDRSPCLIGEQALSGSEEFLATSLIIDSHESVTTITEADIDIAGHLFPQSEVYINENDTYININQSSIAYSEANFLSYGNYIAFNLHGESDISRNGIITCTIVRDIKKVRRTLGGNIPDLEIHAGGYGQEHSLDAGELELAGLLTTDLDSETYIKLSGTVDDTNVEWVYLTYTVAPVALEYLCDSFLILKVEKGSGNECTWSYSAGISGYTTHNIDTGSILDDANNFDGDGNADDYPLTDWTGMGVSDYIGFKVGIPDQHDYDFIQITELFPFSLKIFEVHLWQNVHIDAVINKDFYANVNGRITNSALWEIVSEHPNSIGVTDLGMTHDPATAFSDSTYSWIYDFTINKKINSKKLFEQLSSVSPYIPRFNYLGKFDYTIIPSLLETIPDPSVIINSDEVISFSFSRTKIEEVYTTVVFRYHWDYAREDFNKKRIEWIMGEGNYDTIADGGYDKTYYFKDDAEADNAVLTIDDHRGKYVRDDDTAEQFAKWMLFMHLNQHLKIKTRLPLKYMEIEVGDIVAFDKTIGDTLPYGFEYAYSGGFNNYINGQRIYPLFMVISTNKTLEYVEIEGFQLHLIDSTLDNDGILDDEEEVIIEDEEISDSEEEEEEEENTDIEGCTDSGATNYNPNATIDDGSCVLETPATFPIYSSDIPDYVSAYLSPVSLYLTPQNIADTIANDPLQPGYVLDSISWSFPLGDNPNQVSSGQFVLLGGTLWIGSIGNELYGWGEPYADKTFFHLVHRLEEIMGTSWEEIDNGYPGSFKITYVPNNLPDYYYTDMFCLITEYVPLNFYAPEYPNPFYSNQDYFYPPPTGTAPGGEYEGYQVFPYMSDDGYNIFMKATDAIHQMDMVEFCNYLNVSLNAFDEVRVGFGEYSEFERYPPIVDPNPEASIFGIYEKGDRFQPVDSNESNYPGYWINSTSHPQYGANTMFPKFRFWSGAYYHLRRGPSSSMSLSTWGFGSSQNEQAMHRTDPVAWGIF